MPGFEPKIGIALSGGGAKGAFQVGVLDYLVNEKGVRFDFVAGVSTGALQAVMLAQGDVTKLREVWESIRSRRDIYTGRIGGILGGLLGADSLYDNGPLAEKIRSNVDPDKILRSGTKLRIGVVSLQTGRYRLITEKEPNLHQWILASTAIPFAFEPVVEREEQYVDGGVRDITPLGAVMDEKPDACLVVLASPPGIAPTRELFPNMYAIGLRSIDIMSDEIFVNDLETAEWINRIVDSWDVVSRALAPSIHAEIDSALKPLQDALADYRRVPIHTIAPDRLLLDTLDFDPARIRNAIRVGREQAKQAWPEIEKKFGL